MIKIGKDEFSINRENVRVSEFDKIYCNLLKRIIKEGEQVHNRTGVDTISIPNAMFEVNVGEEFPILESKKVFYQNAITELLWIYQAQSNDVNWLQERGNHIWDEWKIDEEGYWKASQMEPDGKGGLVRKEICKYFGKEWAGTIGTAYGWINDKFKKPQDVIWKLKNNPTDRRMNISLWQDEYVPTAVLPSCVWSSEYKVYNGTVNSFVHQRSADVPLGLPFNVTQYAVLLSLFAKVSNLKPGRMAWSIADAHIYVNQLDGIKLQLRRYKLMLKYEKLIKENDDEVLQFLYDKISNTIDELEKNNLSDNKKYDELKEEKMIFELMVTKDKPMLWLADKEDFFDFDNQKDNKDIKILNYKSAPFIKMPVAQ